MFGDLGNVESQEENLGTNPISVTHRECTTWNGLKVRLSLYEPNKYKRVDSLELQFT
jgi:hypothetical protein